MVYCLILMVQFCITWFVLSNESLKSFVQWWDVINKTLSAVATTVRDRMPRRCRKWVRHGDCYLHQAFMLQNCRRSCMAGGYVNGEYKCTQKMYPGVEWPKGGQAHACSQLMLNQTQVYIPKLVFSFDSPSSRGTDTPHRWTPQIRELSLKKPLKRTPPFRQPATFLIMSTSFNWIPPL